MNKRKEIKKLITYLKEVKKIIKIPIVLKFRYKNIVEDIINETNYLNKECILSERIYQIMNDLYKTPTCIACGNKVKYSSKGKYSLYCSKKCFYKNKNPEIIKKQKESNIKTYREKKDEIINKIKKTNLEKYGVEDPNQLIEIKEKIKKINLKKYGVEYNQQNKEIRQKTIQTNLRKRNVENSFQDPIVKEKIKKSNLERHGVEWSMQSTVIREKAKKTNLEKYGVENPFQNEEIKNKIHYTNRENFLSRLDKILKYLNFELIDSEFINNKYNHKWKCLKCNYEFIENWRNMCRGYRCKNCSREEIGVSKAEKEIFDFIKNLCFENKIEPPLQKINNIIKNPKTNRNLELDIYIPSLKIAVEYDGLYWHSEYFVNSKYHLMKTNLCLEKNIKLIHIFEDEWIYKQNIVKNRIIQILNLNKNTRIHARKCVIKEIIPKEKNEFLEKFHIQGKDNSVIKLGAFYNDELISVMTFSHGNIAKGSKTVNKIWELNRFCSDSNYRIPGIAGKLLKHFQRNYEWKEIFSYADRRWSEGNVYYKLGFELKHIARPSYWYIKDFKRIHRFNLRKRPDEPKDIPEWVLRQQEGYFRFWDCGNLKFVINKEEFL